MTNRTLLLAVLAMMFIIAASNVLVQHSFTPLGLGELLTWGAFTYPITFLVTDLTNRRFGPAPARKVVLVGFVLAVILSIWLATPRIAIASGTAFVTAQLLGVFVFDRLRGGYRWWRAPLFSSTVGSLIDTALFFSLSFAPVFAGLDRITGAKDGSLGLAVPFLGFGGNVALWQSLAAGDFAVKMLIALAMLAPYGVLRRRIGTWRGAPAA